ncbi:TonB-dependent receptor [Sphingomonas cannabina]|uniref:TonB-dependent receptor n=1 Tax=Sphingomonas cannabina TaxID=2899123 RepID=UPI001F234131|nr:TonB-dependent receptor [Sphingomonas cannabina]UIJ43974.1 TonB-dependent receptor [Sphingomonas cannabina]
MVATTDWRATVSWAHLAGLVILTVVVDRACAQTTLQTGAAPDSADQAQGRGQSATVSGAADDIVVTARYGDASVAPETELSESDIEIYGADSIGELIQNIKPLINDQQPVLLVNGKRIGTAAGIAGFPPEALARLAILPPEAAARYGYPSDQRVVNLVLKKQFVSWHAETGVTLPTAGGRDSERLSVGRVVIDGQTQWNAQAQVSRDSSLLKSERRSPRRTPVDLAGHIEGVNGGEIDPELSQLTGRPVTIAGIPPSAVFQPPVLGDFAATADAVRWGDPNDYETLLPSTRSLSFNAGVTRPLGSFSGSLNINATTGNSAQLHGLATTAVTLPAGSPWSPFADDVVLVRGLEGARALRNTQRTQTLGMSLSLSGAIGDWQTTVIANYMRSRSNGIFERGIDGAEIQDLIDGNDPSFDPYGPWQKDRLLIDRNRSRSESLNVQLNVSKAIFSLPAGQVSSNFSAVASRSNAVNSRIDDATGMTSRNAAQRDRLNIQELISIPIASRSTGVLAPLGDLSAELSGSVETGTNVRPQPQFTGRLIWSPFPILQLRGSFSYEEMAPSVDLLDGPRVETVTQIYDFVRQEVADPVLITGGNPDLQRGSRRNLSFNGMLRPFGSQVATINLGYQRQVADGGVASFPTFTPAVEAVFPERVTRDASGRLVAIDARPINIIRDLSEQLTTSLVLRLSTKGRANGGRPGTGTLPARIADPIQLTFSLNHRWQLRSELLIRPGLPVFDRLGGDGAQPRHTVSIQMVAGKRGIGATLSGSWQSAAYVRGAASSSGQLDFRYPTMTQFNLGMFVEPERLLGQARKDSLLSNLRITLDVQNLFDSYRRVTLSDGSVPPGFSRAEIDPLGRTIRLGIRKRF